MARTIQLPITKQTAGGKKDSLFGKLKKVGLADFYNAWHVFQATAHHRKPCLFVTIFEDAVVVVFCLRFLL